MNWPLAKKPEGFGKGSRGNKIPCNVQEIRIGDGSVLPPAHARSKSYRYVATASGSGASGSGLRRGLPQVNLPGQAGPGPAEPSRLVLRISHSIPTVPLTPAITHGPQGGLTRLQGVLLPTFAMVVRTRDITPMGLMDTSEWRYSFSSL